MDGVSVRMTSPRPPSTKDVCAIVVSFNPDARFPERLELLLEQFPEVFVIDNASSTPIGPFLVMFSDRNLSLVSNSANFGIGTALNIGVDRAIEAGYTWAVSFDQDSVASPTLLPTLVEAAEIAGGGKILIGANYEDVHRARPKHRVGSPRAASAVSPMTTLITSGMLFPLGFTKGIGGFREDYFIDSVDHEFCLRAKNHGARVFITDAPLMQHSIGGEGGFLRLGRALSSHHSPMRKYFIARNVLTTIAEQGLRHPAWAARQSLRLLAEIMGTIIFEHDKKAKLQAFGRGFRDAFMKRAS